MYRKLRGAAGDRKTIDFPLKSFRKVSILYPGSLGTVSGRFSPPRVFAVWPGQHALTTRVKRCQPGHTGFRRSGPAHTKQSCLSSGVASATRIDSEGRNWQHSGPPKRRKSHVLLCMSLLFGVPKTWDPYNSANSGWPRRAKYAKRNDGFGDAVTWRVSPTLSDVLDFRSDPTFTRASPGLRSQNNSLKLANIN